jgi:phospholipase A1/A2
LFASNMSGAGVPFSPFSRALLAIIFGIFPSLVTAQEPAETTPDDSPESLEICAKITNGDKRLACYDEFTEPLKAADRAENSDNSEKNVTTAPETVEDADDGVMTDLLDRYMAAEKAIFSFSGSFVGHRPMYILPFSYLRNANRTPTSPRTGTTGFDYELDNQEAKYQISFKVPLLTGFLDGPTTLWFGYTQKSFWQVYNTDESAPFRETNYEPEIFLRYATNYDIGPGTLNGATIGFNHESNGQSEPRSRSWNRIKASVAYSYNRWLFILQPWYRLPESNSEDDNADIQRYLGYANYLTVYRWTEDRTLSLNLMNNLRSDGNKTSVELGYSFPMGDTVKGYIHYYNGYGESLIDYNQRIQRIGIGIMLNDWL